MENLAEKKCVPCEGDVSPLAAEQVGTLLARLGGGWGVTGGRQLEKTYAFPDFALALAFTNRVGEMAEVQGHHPDIYLTWGKVTLSVWTHAAGGLTENDFILAAHADGLTEHP